MEIEKALAPIIARLPNGYRIETGGNIEDSTKANSALAPVFPIMVLLTLLVLVLQTRSLSAMTMVFLTAPLGLVGAVPILLVLHQPFGFNAILGLIGLSGILMRNTLILIGQIHTNEAQGLDPYDAVVEATVQRRATVLLTALAAVLAFIPLTTSVFWGSMAFTLIGGTAAGTVLTLLFLPASLCIWFLVRTPIVHSTRGGVVGASTVGKHHCWGANASPCVARLSQNVPGSRTRPVAWSWPPPRVLRERSRSTIPRSASWKYPPYWIVGTMMRMIPDINLAAGDINSPGMTAVRTPATFTSFLDLEPGHRCEVPHIVRYNGRSPPPRQCEAIMRSRLTDRLAARSSAARMRA